MTVDDVRNLRYKIRQDLSIGWWCSDHVIDSGIRMLSAEEFTAVGERYEYGETYEKLLTFVKQKVAESVKKDRYHPDGELITVPFLRLRIEGHKTEFKAIGWLRGDMPFETGESTPEFLLMLHSVVMQRHVSDGTRGWHTCNLPDCKETERISELNFSGCVVPLGEFVAPPLIYHYVKHHNYLPPQEFIDAVVREGYLLK